ncbi:mitochondrial outer membrane protein porin 2-like isoform X2 [Magnolia sinica]|uniref:mitochondrial outer membrane protein porin 2-like isoform X2 n=1 Tax=Magnolia sinica TaxID=86752 RepID=UPI002657AEF8|nr:mitochondrial outer membrane protein porin 2-like isoform X2 [Magnolia sinica]
MSKGPGLFSDIGKKAKDLLTKDYSYDQKFTVTTYSDDVGVGLTSTAVKKGGLSTGDIAAQYKYKNTIIDVKVDTGSNILTTLTISEVVPSTKTIASFKLPDYNSGKLEVQYFHEHATFTTAVALNQSPALDLTGTIGTQSFSFGAEAGYDSASGSFTKYNAGVSVTKPDSSASVILADKGDMLKASYVHHLDQLRKSAAVAEITRRFSTNENTFTVGGAYAVDPLTVVKTRLNNHGQLGALLQHELKPKSVLTISGEFDTKALDQNPRFGLSLALKP